MNSLSHMLRACVLVFPLASLAAGQTNGGWTLFQPTNSSTTQLIDEAGAVVQAWGGVTTPGLSVYMLPDGDIVRTQRLVSGLAGSGGGIERLTWDGTVVWQLQHFGADFYQHHDIEVLPNGNVLLVVYHFLTGQDAIDLGRDPTMIGTVWAPDKVVELEPTGPTTANVVWEWRAIDHVVQDFDIGKPNFGVIADTPGRIDINYPPGVLASSGDWLHVNGIDYNPELDQVMLSVPFYNELWIIDHSTTTAEAAGSTGGNSGKGGDLLYRWGNPQAYDRGTGPDQQFFFIHDATWIEPGMPGAGNLLVFNNGRVRPTGNWSSADELIPPVDAQGNYTLAAGQAYGPSGLHWTYSDNPSFFSNIMSGAERLPNGNTLITEATSSRMFEVTDAGQVVWEHISTRFVFKSRRYATGIDPTTAFCNDDDGSLASCPCANPGATHTGCDLAQGTGGVSLTIVGQDTSPQNRVTWSGTGFPSMGTPSSLVIRAGGLDTGSPVVFGDGLRCIGTPVVRLAAQFAIGGTVTHTHGHGAGAGSGNFYYQLWFRNTPIMYCDPAAAFNLSNGRTLAW